MNINFALILLILVLISGILAAIDKFYLAKFRDSDAPMPLWAEYARSFFPILLVVFLLRSFLVEPYRIPSGSLEPTLLVGDFILVNKFDYGVRLPISHDKLMRYHEPRTGDIVVFRWPPDTSIDYIKRVIGVPGDRIQYHNKTLTINGQPVPQTLIGYETDTDAFGNVFKVEKRAETLAGKQHFIYVRPDYPTTDFDVTVPAGHYFMMGDNRDDSSDSRVWGFLPEHNLIGKAFAVWMSWDGLRDTVRWSRIGSKIQ